MNQGVASMKCDGWDWRSFGVGVGEFVMCTRFSSGCLVEVITKWLHGKDAVLAREREREREKRASGLVI